MDDYKADVIATSFLNTLLFSLIGFAIFFTKSAWPLFGLIMLLTVKRDICNKCGHDLSSNGEPHDNQ